MKDKKDVKLNVLICLLIIMVIAIVTMGYYMYKMYNKKEDNSQAGKLNNQISNVEQAKDNVDETSKTDEKEQKESKEISVVDAVNYTDGYYDLFKVKLPRIVGNTETIEKLNSKILNEVLPLTYDDVVCHATTENEQTIAMSKGSIHDYTYIIKDNILIIYIYSTVPEGGTKIETTEDGLIQHSYYYDITNDKILSIDEVANKLKLSLEGLKTPEGKSIKSYSELEKNGYIVRIKDNNIELYVFTN